MTLRKSIFTIIFLLTVLDAYAGNLQNGVWQAAGCGLKPPSPTVNTQSVDDFNKSIKDINAWQAKAQEYYNCIVKEANTDNDAIAKAAQDEFKQEVNRIQKAANEGKAKVEKNKRVRFTTLGRMISYSRIAALMD